MKPNLTTALRRITGLLACTTVGVLLLATVSPARAGVIIPELSVVGGTGVPASTVSVTLALADDITETASSADVDLTYPPDLLTFNPPIAQNCAVASRLANDYDIGGRLDGEGLLILSIFVKGTPPTIPHLGNGPLASCDFFINAGVSAGTAALVIENPGLFDSDGNPLDVNTKDGAVVISNATPTFTPTVTPTKPPTSTVTATRTSTATATITGTKVATGTPTSTATATNTKPTATNTPATPVATSTETNTPQNTATATRTGGTPTATKQSGGGGGGGCDIVPVQQSTSGGTLALLLAPMLLLWVRRRF
jgi:hypothetical protein